MGLVILRGEGAAAERAGDPGYKPEKEFILRRHSQVAKATVCKTVIPRFESGCRLQSFLLLPCDGGLVAARTKSANCKPEFDLRTVLFLL